jgi:hypothetical protein
MSDVREVMLEPAVSPQFTSGDVFRQVCDVWLYSDLLGRLIVHRVSRCREIVGAAAIRGRVVLGGNGEDETREGLAGSTRRRLCGACATSVEHYLRECDIIMTDTLLPSRMFDWRRFPIELEEFIAHALLVVRCLDEALACDGP